MGALNFDAFLASVDPSLVEFVAALHRDLTEAGCKIEVKEAKSGYLVSYLYNKKALANYVFRKKGMMVRIYGNHIFTYGALLDTLPPEMVSAIQGAPECKRLLRPDDCNPKCAMGYDFILQGQRHQKCRNGAFFFLLCEAHKPYIEAFLKQELAARRSA